jgi:hypothetical protein
MTAIACLIAAAALVGFTGAQENPFAGTWVANMEKSKPHPDYPLRAITLRISVAGDTVTMEDEHIHASGKEISRTQAFQVDGKERPFEAPSVGSGVTVVAQWAGPHVLDTVLKQNGTEITRVVYEVSPDGKTMTATRTGRWAQTAVFDRK